MRAPDEPRDPDWAGLAENRDQQDPAINYYPGNPGPLPGGTNPWQIEEEIAGLTELSDTVSEDIAASLNAAVEEDRADKNHENSAEDQQEAKGASERHKESASEQHPDLAQREVGASIEETFEACVERLVELIAAAHGLALPYAVAKLVCGIVEWQLVAEGRGGIDVPLPVLLGPHAVLEVTVHLGGDPETPPLTLSVAPSGASGIGALAFKGLEIDPSPSHARTNTDWSQDSSERLSRVEVVPWQTRTEPQENPSLSEIVIAAREQEEEEELPQLRRRHGHDDDLDLVVGYDSAMRLAVWRDLRR